MKRFSDEVTYDVVALSGMKFFHITRKLVLSVSDTRAHVRNPVIGNLISFVKRFSSSVFVVVVVVAVDRRWPARLLRTSWC